ncbi:hypothetical protein AJ88_25305 [Mesorhizobium amorphae CCBAU 01583]|nr:hypothetical protein AJ88_25305 [Mesorhizobium amorphae CCBAU 01583]
MSWVEHRFDLGDTFYGSRPTVAIDPVEDAIAIRQEEPRACSMRTRSVQIPFVADHKFNVFGDEIETIS